MTLHILSNPEKAELCLQSLTTDDDIILIGDGTYCFESYLKTNLHILNEDAEARGVTNCPDSKKITYTQFIELSIKHTNSISWF